LKKVLFVFGTRPEAIKMAPLINEMVERKNFNVKICITAQHREMLDQVLNIFNIKPDFDLNVMKQNQKLEDITSLIIKGVGKVIDQYEPDLVLVHGDTTTTFSATISAFYRQVKVGHVEAGLRTGNILSPWPEEANRKLTGAIANFHFAPTEIAKNNLLKENINKKNIIVTGNTVIDSLKQTIKKISQDKLILSNLKERFNFLDENKKLILVTGHRRESFGESFKNICLALKKIAVRNKDIQIIYPVHLNPKIKNPTNKILKNINNIFLLEPQDYLAFCYLMEKSYIVLTDSGGIQEEAPSLGKPVLVMRETTERPEAIEANTVKLVGTNQDKILTNTELLINDLDHYKMMSNAVSPYGDGKAAKRIADFLVKNENKRI
tara:strand:+ start:3191 stop:4327 length:1137 start_codon:yes stop_codon:yes gene_type:complete